MAPSQHDPAAHVAATRAQGYWFDISAVAAAAIVDYADGRLGERACAFVVLRCGAAPSLADVQTYMDECKVAKQYRPEQVEAIAGLPHTASGKIRKFVLKERAKRCATGAASTGT